jgi:transcriptional regulator with XRE-family HTH domain
MAQEEPRESPTERTIGERVRTARERLGWNRETLAFHSGVSWSAISQVESGRRSNLRLATLSALASALAVSIDYLVTGQPSAPPMLEHRALLYKDEDEFAASIVPFLNEAAERAEPALAVTTDENIELLRDRLGSAAESVEFVERSSWYPAPRAALAGYSEFLDKAIAAGGNWVRIVGEIAWDPVDEPAVVAWGHYESLLNLTFATMPATVVCPYDMRALSPEIVDVARATHPHIIDSTGVTGSSRYTALGDLLPDS